MAEYSSSVFHVPPVCLILSYQMLERMENKSSSLRQLTPYFQPKKTCECVWRKWLMASWNGGDGGVVEMNQSLRNKCNLAQHCHLHHHHHLCLLACLHPLYRHHPVILPASIHHAQHQSKCFAKYHLTVTENHNLGIPLPYKTLWWSFQGLTVGSVRFPE